ncbi:MAG: hypothetical protein ACYC77_12100, partial [Coriobacteriia bacterium]
CGMGMMSGSLRVGAAAPGSGGGIPPIVPISVVAIVALGGGLMALTRREGGTLSPREAIVITVAVAAAIIVGLSVGGSLGN